MAAAAFYQTASPISAWPAVAFQSGVFSPWPAAGEAQPWLVPSDALQHLETDGPASVWDALRGSPGRDAVAGSREPEGTYRRRGGEGVKIMACGSVKPRTKPLGLRLPPFLFTL